MWNERRARGGAMRAGARPMRLGLLALVLSGCTVTDDASFRRATAERLPPAAASNARAEVDASDGAIPEGPIGASVRRGRAILLATRDSLPRNVGNGLTCVSCHLDEGRRPYAMPWTGVVARYPQYRPRSGSVDRLEDRINQCFQRSLAGRPLAHESTAMRDIVSYMAHLSRGVPVGTRVTGQGVDSVKAAAPGDTGKGRAVYAANCARCHGDDGAGTPKGPPTWGPKSFTQGAGMARWRLATAFVRHNMPIDRKESLTDQEAVDVGTFLAARPRPDYPAKARDWPRGGAPDDAKLGNVAGRPRRAASQ